MRSSAPVVRSILRSAVAPQRAGLTAGMALSRSSMSAMVANGNVNSSSCSFAPIKSVRSFSNSTQVQAEFESPFGVNSLAKLTEEEEMLRDSVRRFAEEVIQPRVEAMDEAEKMDKEIINGLFEQGLMGIETSEEHNGAGCSFTAAIIVIEELAKVDPSVSVLCDVHNTLVDTVLRKYASKELQDKYLPKLATEMLGCFCLSEPSSGSDAFAMKSSYKKNDDGSFTIDAQKMWITNSEDADFFILFAQGDPSKGYKGISAFAITRDMGVEIAKKEKKLGIKASSTCTVNFDSIKVPKENLIGEEGKGYKIAIEILNEGRVGIGAQMVGLAQGAFNKAIKYAYERKQFGKPVASFQGMQFQFAEAAMQIEAARTMVYNAARLKEEGRPFTKEAAMAKLYASQVAQSVSGSAIEWCGGMGFTRETGIEKYWRDSKIGAIYEGTSNIQRQTIAKLVEAELGLKN